MRSNSLETIYRCIIPSRWEIFTCLVEKKPINITELTHLLNKDYANVWKDIQALQGLEIIKLKKKVKKSDNCPIWVHSIWFVSYSLSQTIIKGSSNKNRKIKKNWPWIKIISLSLKT